MKMASRTRTPRNIGFGAAHKVITLEETQAPIGYLGTRFGRADWPTLTYYRQQGNDGFVYVCRKDDFGRRELICAENPNGDPRD
jgi:hypothetical protein